MGKYKVNPTDSDVKEWEKQYGEGLIVLEDESKGSFYFKPVDYLTNYIQVISRFFSFMRQQDIVQAGQVLTANTALGGSVNFNDSPPHAVAIGLQLVAMVDLPKVAKKKNPESNDSTLK
mgnify:CR=1 FL=1